MKYIYLDHAATTPLHEAVYEEMKPYYLNLYGNPSSLHLYGDRAEDCVTSSRKLIAKMIGAKEGKIVFTSGGSESNNLALKGITQKYKKYGNHIIVSAIEHDSVLSTCQHLEEQGYDVTYVPVNKYGQVNIDELSKALSERTILVSVMHANNEVGTIQPIEQIGSIIKQYRHAHNSKMPFFHCDAVQTVGKEKIEATKWGIDALSFSAHKFYGPKGIGVLWINRGLRIDTLIHGGGQEFGFRSGTQNVPGIVGATKALQLCYENRDTLNRHYESICSYTREKLEKIKGVTLSVPEKVCLPTHIHFICDKIEGQAIMQELSRQGIAISTSSACHARHWAPSHVMTAMGHSVDKTRQAVRITMGKDITIQDIDYFIEKLNGIINHFRTNITLSQ